MRKIDIFLIILGMLMVYIFMEFQSNKLDSKENKDLIEFDTIGDLLMKGNKLKERES